MDLMAVRRNMMGVIAQMISNNNVIRGTFNFDSSKKGTAQDINLNYTGSGYPIAIAIYPSEGSKNVNGSLYPLLKVGLTIFYFAMKCTIGDNCSPNYTNETSDNNKAYMVNCMKNSSSDPSATANSSGQIPAYWNTNAFENSLGVVFLKDSTTMSVYVSNTSKGFADGIEYSYTVVYS